MQKEQTLRVGVVGVGAIGREHIKRINTKLQGAKVVACSDVNADFAKSVAKKYGCKFYSKGEDVVNADDVDAVVVTSSDPTHERYVTASIKARKHVFCEKPLAPEADACRRIVDAEIAAGKKLVQVGFMRRYDAGYLQLKKAIEKRTYGEPLLVHCAHRNASVAPDYDTPMAITSTMIHEIDTIRWLLDEDYATVELVFAKDTRRTNAKLRDPQIMYLTTKSGVRIDVESFVNTGHCYDIKCEVCCEDAILNLPDPANIEVLAKAVRGHTIGSDWSTRFIDAYNVELQDWIDATKKGRVNGPTAWDGYVAEVTATAAAKARDTKSVVKIQLGAMPSFYKKN